MFLHIDNDMILIIFIVQPEECTQSVTEECQPVRDLVHGSQAVKRAVSVWLILKDFCQGFFAVRQKCDRQIQQIACRIK